jgi:hypothetical protein
VFFLWSSSRCSRTQPSSWPALLFSPLDISPGRNCCSRRVWPLRHRLPAPPAGNGTAAPPTALLRTSSPTAMVPLPTRMTRPSRLPQQRSYPHLLCWGAAQHRPRRHSSTEPARAGVHAMVSTLCCGARQLRSAGCLCPQRRCHVLVMRPRRLLSLAGWVASGVLQQPAPERRPMQSSASSNLIFDRLTRLRTGAVQRVNYQNLSTTSTSPLPASYCSALATPSWCAAMADKYKALIDKTTW